MSEKTEIIVKQMTSHERQPNICYQEQTTARRVDSMLLISISKARERGANCLQTTKSSVLVLMNQIAV